MSAISALLQTDAYKLDHRRQYPPDTTKVYSNWTNRKSRVPGVDHVVHFGLQAYLQRWLMDAFKPFFAAERNTVEDAYYDMLVRVLGETNADAIGTDHITALHDLGYIPLRFCAVPEGTRVPIRVPTFTVENTHPDFAWLVNYFEPGISAAYWLPSTSATLADVYRKLLDAAAERTGASSADVDFQCHDFSFRGISSPESAAASATGHLLSFKGTDSLPSLEWIDDYYGGEFEAKSIPATEHSVMSSGIAYHMTYDADNNRTIAEKMTFEDLLNLYPSGNLAIVSDTFNLWDVCTKILPALKDKIMARDGKLIIRPDSGDPQTILIGEGSAVHTPAGAGVVKLLADTFGYTRNAKGCMELDPHIGVIYGDSITPQRADDITYALESLGWVSTTVTLGVGSFSYQYQTRDTFGSAMKATWAEIDGEGVNVFKDPVTDDGTKRSATGRLAVGRRVSDSQLVLFEQADPVLEANSLLQPIWEDGKFLVHQSFEDVRKVLQGS